MNYRFKTIFYSLRYTFSIFANIVLIFFIFTHNPQAQGVSYTGLVENLEKLLEIHKSEYEKLWAQTTFNTNALQNLNQYDSIEIHPLELKSFIFHSNEDFLKIIGNDECKFYSLLELGLLRNTLNKNDEIIINLKKTMTEKSEKETLAENVIITKMTKTDFLNEVYKKKCITNKEMNIMFNPQNLLKTINSIQFQTPQNDAECQSILSSWQKNPFTPYLCKSVVVSKSLKQFSSNSMSAVDKKANEELSRIYNNSINNFQRTYLDSLCNNLMSPNGFCKNYLKNDVWNKITRGEFPQFKMEHLCSLHLKKAAPLSSNDLKTCAYSFNANPNVCELLKDPKHPSNFPYVNCHTMSELLKNSKLETRYTDCPSRIDHDGITNFNRIFQHFAPPDSPLGKTVINYFKTQKNTSKDKSPSSSESCFIAPVFTFYKMNLNVQNPDALPLKICFKNKVFNNEECLPYIPGDVQEEPLSEINVVQKIFYMHYGSASKMNCRLIDVNEFRPTRSEFKSGCFIVYPKENCSTFNCTKKIYVDLKVIDDIKYIGTQNFDYFPNAYKNERYSINNLLKEVLNIEMRAVKNLNDAMYLLKNIPKGIMHGIGCAEDLLSDKIKRISLNQCQPLPFIIDSWADFNGESFLGIRYANDESSSIRPIRWPDLFNAILNYKEIHPLDHWMLYGLKK